MNELNETTRCYPRTMSEAFPDDVESQSRLDRGAWFERHEDNNEQITNIMMAFMAGFFVSMVIFIN